MIVPELKHLLSLDVRVSPPVVIDPGPSMRRLIPITGGTVSGTHTGRILPGGDWQSQIGDGPMAISAHYILDLEGHGTVEVQSDGLRAGPPEVLAALARGEIVDPSRYYFRTAIRLRTAAPQLLRFNSLMCVATGARYPGRVEIEVFELG